MKNKLYFPILILIMTLNCGIAEIKPEHQDRIGLNLQYANKLAALPMACIQKEFPNKPGQVIRDTTDLKRPNALHPAFFGCFDWHSAVHGHWSLIKLMKSFPELEKGPQIITMLRENLSKENIKSELKYFENHRSFERPYGWAWYLKLVEELHTWEHPLSAELEQNLFPLTQKIEQGYMEYLPKLLYPIREGTHSNTAFGLSFAWDYANTLLKDSLKMSIESRARDYFLSDQNCPISYEPGGEDFLSPCLQEIDIMRRVLNREEFSEWIDDFMPGIKYANFALSVGEVSDRQDGYLVHLDGLNFSRAWVLYGLAEQYPEYKHLISIANQHVNHSLPNLVNDSYEGGHWLGSFALYSLGN